MTAYGGGGRGCGTVVRTEGVRTRSARSIARRWQKLLQKLKRSVATAAHFCAQGSALGGADAIVARYPRGLWIVGKMPPQVRAKRCAARRLTLLTS